MAKSKNKATILAKQKVTLRGRFIYTKVFEPVTDEYREEEYSVGLLVDKSDVATMETINSTLKWLGSNEVSIKDMDIDNDNPIFANKILINMHTRNKPDVIDLNGELLTEQTFYSGCYGNVSCVFAKYSLLGKIGVTVYLNHILKIADGGVLGVTNALQDFGTIIDKYVDSENRDDYIQKQLTLMGAANAVFPQLN